MVDTITGFALVGIFLLGIGVGWRISRDNRYINEMIDKGLYDPSQSAFLPPRPKGYKPDPNKNNRSL